ncbi:hypothetical protein V1294_005890 [Bradyrhizobium sp. AZCC 1678]|uniref:Uncharacterized protein n=1 Tax=Bradyrhizobium algeriense TaxID=634784 RepID=A0ABU8B6K7_9BRAD
MYADKLPAGGLAVRGGYESGFELAGAFCKNGWVHKS